MEYNNHHTIHLLIDYWGISSTPPHIALNIFSSSSPEIITSMVDKIKTRLSKHHLDLQPDKDNYDNYVRHVITGDLLKGKGFPSLFEQEIIAALIEVQKQFFISPQNITIAKNYGILGGICEATEEEIKQLLKLENPKIYSPSPK